MLFLLSLLLLLLPPVMNEYDGYLMILMFMIVVVTVIVILLVVHTGSSLPAPLAAKGTVVTLRPASVQHFAKARPSSWRQS